MNDKRRLSQEYSIVRYALLGLAIFLSAFSIIPIFVVAHSKAASAGSDIKVLGTSNLHNSSAEDNDIACAVLFFRP